MSFEQKIMFVCVWWWGDKIRWFYFGANIQRTQKKYKTKGKKKVSKFSEKKKSYHALLDVLIRVFQIEIFSESISLDHFFVQIEFKCRC